MAPGPPTHPSLHHIIHTCTHSACYYTPSPNSCPFVCGSTAFATLPNPIAIAVAMARVSAAKKVASDGAMMTVVSIDVL